MEAREAPARRGWCPCLCTAAHSSYSESCLVRECTPYVLFVGFDWPDCGISRLAVPTGFACEEKKRKVTDPLLSEEKKDACDMARYSWGTCANGTMQ